MELAVNDMDRLQLTATSKKSGVDNEYKPEPTPKRDQSLLNAEQVTLFSDDVQLFHQGPEQGLELGNGLFQHSSYERNFIVIDHKVCRKG